MVCPGHIQQGLWTHPRDQSVRYTDLAYWMDLARLLERGLFDGLFLADVLGIYDVYGGTPEAALRGGVQVPLLDPLFIVPAMAAVTTHLGFGVTCNLTYETPYLFARRMSTLDHLTQGRIGWNVVTGYLDSAARAMGQAAQPAHDDRYDQAEDFLGAVYALWEASWADHAVRRDKAGRLYTEPSRVWPIRAGGIDAIHLCEPSPQRTPVLFQAGTSERGRAFAARHAECVFVNGSTPEIVAGLVADLRARAAPREIKVFVGATLIVGRTEPDAQSLLDEYAACADAEATLAHASASLGFDFASVGLDDPITIEGSQAIRSNVEAMARTAGPAWTKRKLLAQSVLGSRQKPIVGDPAQVADALAHWMNVADVDGFNVSRTVMPECLHAVIDLLVPVLQERGLYKTQYAAGTYREKLFGAGARLPALHAARQAGC
jgi:FMN-dependent oxidoreductase (nitrilotriacetate monooxygenase family)